MPLRILMIDSAIVWAKLCAVAAGLWILEVATAIEPSKGVWGAAIAGSLLAIPVGRDRSIGHMLVRALVGPFVATLITEIVIIYTPTLPKPVVAGLLGLFSASAAIYLMDRAADGDWSWLPKWMTPWLRR